jgi:hypothetical protein
MDEEVKNTEVEETVEKVFEPETVNKVVEPKTTKKQKASTEVQSTEEKFTLARFVTVQFDKNSTYSGEVRKLPFVLAKKLEANGKLKIVDNVKN